VMRCRDAGCGRAWRIRIMKMAEDRLRAHNARKREHPEGSPEYRGTGMRVGSNNGWARSRSSHSQRCLLTVIP